MQCIKDNKIWKQHDNANVYANVYVCVCMPIYTYRGDELLTPNGA